MLKNNKSLINRPHILNIENNIRLNANDGIKLIIKGQGVFSFKNPSLKPFKLEFCHKEKTLSLQVNKKNTKLFLIKAGVKTLISDYKNVKIDKDKNAIYWFSLNSLSSTILFGIGEVRYGLSLIQKELDIKWLGEIERLYSSDNVMYLELYRDPIVYDPSLKVKKTDLVSIEDIARNNYIVPINLNPSVRKLYQNISGANFNLDTPDFPNFMDAIEKSIKDTNGWCYKKLKEKAKEFGSNQPNETYLRITLGANQGESPGIPYVIEIWPPGHYSPIHNHANANAIIRVLSGEINVELYPMLSKHHKKPFNTATFRKDDITWISSRYNQIHKLHNVNTATCVTIQCYLYGKKDNNHYEYFDYLDADNKIQQFTPNSDMDFLSFKDILKKECLNAKQE